MTPDAALPYQMAALGLFIGSFLNVCILRVPAGMSVARPASRCPRCGHALAWFENIPVVSFLVLRRRCRQCHAPISWQYPIVELVTCLVFIAATLQYGFSWLLVSRLVLLCAMIVLFMTDLRHRTLPLVITVPVGMIGLLFSLVADPGLASSLVGAAVGGGLLAIAVVVARILRPEGLEISDVMMIAAIGAFLGWKVMLLTLVLSLVAALLVGFGLMVTRRRDTASVVPFGALLAAAAIVSCFAGDWMLRWIELA